MFIVGEKLWASFFKLSQLSQHSAKNRWASFSQLPQLFQLSQLSAKNRLGTNILFKMFGKLGKLGKWCPTILCRMLGKLGKLGKWCPTTLCRMLENLENLETTRKKTVRGTARAMLIVKLELSCRREHQAHIMLKMIKPMWKQEGDKEPRTLSQAPAEQDCTVLHAEQE